MGQGSLRTWQLLTADLRMLGRITYRITSSCIVEALARPPASDCPYSYHNSTNPLPQDGTGTACARLSELALELASGDTVDISGISSLLVLSPFCAFPAIRD